MPGQKRLALGGIALLCSLFLVRSLHRASELPPLHNWDLTAYVALAIAYEGSEPEEVHRRTYEALRAELPPKVFADLTNGGVKRKRFEDPAALYQHLGFYRARIFFTFPVYLLNKLFGVPWTNATYWISRASWIGLALLMCLWASRSLGPYWGMPVGTLLAHAPWFVASMGFSSPDLQASLLTCLGIYFLVELRRDLVGAALLTATIGVRPDTVILALVLAAGIWFFDREQRPSRRFFAIWCGASLAAYFAVSKYAGAYGWWPLFWISFAQKEEFPAQIDTSPRWDLYFQVLRMRWEEIPGHGYYATPRRVTGSTVPLAFAGAVLAAVALIRRSGNPALARYTALFAAFFVTYSVRWLLFPQLWDRFFTVAYACVPLILLSIASGVTPSGPPRARFAGAGGDERRDSPEMD